MAAHPWPPELRAQVSAKLKAMAADPVRGAKLRAHASAMARDPANIEKTKRTKAAKKAAGWVYRRSKSGPYPNRSSSLPPMTPEQLRLYKNSEAPALPAMSQNAK